LNLNHKKIFIAPHTPKSTMLEKVLKETFLDVEILGFIDKEKIANNIFRIENIPDKEFDFILIYSPNHFDSIYTDYKKKINSKKLIQIDVQNNSYIFNTDYEISKNRTKNISSLIKLNLLKSFVSFFDFFNIKRDEIVFVSKDFVGTNNKVLFIETLKSTPNALLLTDNKKQIEEFSKNGIKTLFFGTVLSFYKLAKAKIIVQDQGNSNFLVKYLSSKQKKIQLWHGIPLKRMNKLVDIFYDYHISTSDFVNETSLSLVVQAEKHLDFGYPRNDLLLKKHEELDLLFVDLKIYNLAKKNKIIVYMPTHRESEPSFGNKSAKELPLNLEKLNGFMKKQNAFFILKLHPFVLKLYENNNFSNIVFYESQGDIYPVLKYTDILITDYSSVYFDFLLIDKPIIFFDYDYEEYSLNMNGFVYNYEENTPGKKVKTQVELEKSIQEILNGKDLFKKQRMDILNKFFTFKDNFSANRIINILEK
jgi:CDP-glycerol glycerophosphotransferase (TagB/SpsB family)